jgi:hypothetical protein
MRCADFVDRRVLMRSLFLLKTARNKGICRDAAVEIIVEKQASEKREKHAENRGFQRPWVWQSP